MCIFTEIMQPTQSSQVSGSRRPTLGGLFILVGYILIGGVISSLILIGILAISRGIGFPQAEVYLRNLVTNSVKISSSWFELMWVQAINHLGTFLVPALAYWYTIERRTWQQFNQQPLPTVQGLGLVPLLVIAFIPFNAFVIEWNQNLHLPETLAPVEEWMRSKEKELEGITKYLTNFTTTGQLLIALLVVAVIPGIGEEVLFRGILQRNFSTWTRNAHVGIWLSAALFSAIHVQFLGFFPRMLLGALFGYLYLWSGNIWVPMLAHFINNGFTVLMVFLHQQKLITVDIDKAESVPILGALVSGMITVGLLAYFKKLNTNRGL